MKQGDIYDVSRVAIASFSNAVASELSREGVETFLKLAAPEAFAQRMNEDNTMFVYEDHGETVGIIELKEGRHVAMLFVDPEKQQQGINRSLVQEALRHRYVQVVTVSASLPSVLPTKSMGLKVAGDEAEEHGLRFIPMEIELNNSLNSPASRAGTPA